MVVTPFFFVTTMCGSGDEEEDIVRGTVANRYLFNGAAATAVVALFLASARLALWIIMLVGRSINSSLSCIRLDYIMNLN